MGSRAERRAHEMIGVEAKTKGEIQHKGNNKGKIQIEYYSQAELERLIELFESIK